MKCQVCNVAAVPSGKPLRLVSLLARNDSLSLSPFVSTRHKLYYSNP